MADLPEQGKLGLAAQHSEASLGRDLPTPLSEEGEPMSLREYREHAERTYILATLDETDWNVSQAAGLLGVERTNLHKKMRSYGIRREDHQ